jgi:hypothetical protein
LMAGGVLAIVVVHMLTRELTALYPAIQWVP